MQESRFPDTRHPTPEPRSKSVREAGWIAALFALYLIFTVYGERVAQQTTSIQTPSSFNVKASGLKAYYLLLKQQGFQVHQMEAPLQTLGENDALVVISEPIDRDRAIQPDELKALKKWVEAGGSLIYFAASPPRDFDTGDMLLGDVALVSGDSTAKEVNPAESDSPYLANVGTISYQSPVRLKLHAKTPYQTLIRDDEGTLLIHKTLGKGHLFLSALGDIASNATIRKADNAILLVNFAAHLAKEDQTINFDEYHHGIGFAAEGIGAEGVWAAVPGPLRMACYAGLLLGAVLLYNGNRIFGRTRTVVQPGFRASTDYVGSLATLLQRAGASDLAIATLYNQFVRDLRKNLDLEPESTLDVVVNEAQRCYSLSAPQLQQTLLRCEQAAQGQRIREAEMLQLAQHLEFFRRVCHLV